MKIPNGLKIAYWVILTATISYFFIYLKYDLIEKGNHLYLFIFLIWVVLLLLPFFNEIKLFGMTFKKEIESVKKEVEALRLSINTSIHQSTNISIDREPRITPKEEQLLKQVGENQPAAHTLEIPENVDELFRIRYNLEKELRRVDKLYFWTEGEKERTIPLNKIIADLKGGDIIDDDLYHLVRATYQITNAAIHGRDDLLKIKEIDLIKKVGPDIIDKLKVIN